MQFPPFFFIYFHSNFFSPAAASYIPLQEEQFSQRLPRVSESFILRYIRILSFDIGFNLVPDKRMFLHIKLRIRNIRVKKKHYLVYFTLFLWGPEKSIMISKNYDSQGFCMFYPIFSKVCIVFI